jgi:hypothetical protein
MPASTEQRLTLPAREELDAALRACTNGFNEVEMAETAICAIADFWESDPAERRHVDVPTLEQIGSVFSFLTSLKSHHDEMERLIDQLEVAIRDLDTLRLNAEVQRA